MPLLTRYFSAGSNGLTLVILGFLLVFIAFYNLYPRIFALSGLITCSSLLCLNFIVGVIRKRILSNKPWLLVFHLCLIAMFIQLLISQATYLKGTTEVGVNQQFDGELHNVQAGPFHDYQLNPESFTNLGFQINYLEGIQRDNTLNRVEISDNNGRKHVIEIGDHIPLVIGHYRFYTSHNKGYSPIFTWIPDNAPAITGGINLPAYPLNEYKQSLEWSLPRSSQKLWTMLVIEEEVMPESRDFSFQVPTSHHLIVRLNDHRWKMLPGDQIDLPGGKLRYDYLSSWMGYTVDYDWVRPWLVVTCLIGIFSLALHYLRILRAKNHQSID